MKKWLFIALRVIVSALLVYFIVTKIDFSSLFTEILPKLPLWLLFFTIAISFFRLWVGAERWKLLNTDDKFQLSRWDYFRYMMISNTFSLIMPGMVGGDFVRAVWIGADIKSNRTRNILSIFFDRLSGVLSLIIISTFFFMVSPFFLIRAKMIWLSVFMLIIAAIILTVLLIKRNTFYLRILNWQPKKRLLLRLKNVLIIIRDIVINYISRPKIIIYSFLLSFAIHLLGFFVHYLIAVFLEMGITFFDMSLVNSIVLMITSIPISISGIGLREISYITLFGKYGVSAEKAIAMSVYFFAIGILFALAGLPFVIMLKRKKKNRQTQSFNN